MAEEFIIAGWLDYGPSRDQVLEHFAVVAAASRAEPGCLDYTVCADPENPGRVGCSSLAHDRLYLPPAVSADSVPRRLT